MRVSLPTPLGVGLAALALCVAFGCASSAPLRVGTSGDYAPFSNDGEGFDIEVARRFAADQGRPLELVPFRWPELGERMARGDFDVAMSGVTWRADRDVHGWMSLAVGRGGPCWIGPVDPKSVGVNRGGMLEGFARARFRAARIEAVDDNESLPALLAEKKVEAIVTDTFELSHFRRPGELAQCDAETFRKVYWVTPAQAAELGPELDRFLIAREEELSDLRGRWFGARQETSAVDYVLDLVARRLELQPFVGAWKREHSKPIEDLAQEARVLDAVESQARALDLEPAAVRRLFELEIRIGKRIQGQAGETPGALDLDTELRPALARLSERQLDALARAAPITQESLETRGLAPLAVLVTAGELAELLDALAAIAHSD